MSSPYACPFCRALLECSVSSLLCRDCGREFAVNSGIPDFSTRGHYWNQLDERRMDVLLDITRKHGFRYGVENLLGAFDDPYLVGYILDEGRADFRAVLPLTSQSSVLDLGGGWGAVACALAPGCGSVTSVDTSGRNLEFIRLRAEQSGISNVSLARIDPLDDARLPFPDNSFDVAILNGVLEYVGAARTDLAPGEVQLLCLKEIRRIVKPGGALYVGIENRYGYLYFLGTRDHSTLRYTSLLPRALANLVTRMLLRKPYRTYTYSYRGYRKLMESAGFDATSIYLAYPSYREPRFILPSDNESALVYFVKRHSCHLRSRIQRTAVSILFRVLPPRLSSRLMVNTFYCYLLVAERQP